ncbi:TPA: hypothetical protein N0F65_004404 [Lagenidium giganteum]|uniref:Uncharacterized protein n=1 Tax=Lagenidium giganteum TaxID=4803 RepID=A0AAV2ZJ00_9STRA|nr:TPA: hypothetical protein N0F65_004404 [Lagenidium giganteum]
MAQSTHMRRLVCTGRAYFQNGDVEEATRHWKKALDASYKLQDYAVTYVLSANLGDALAVTNPDAADYRSRLEQAVAYYDYALSLLDQCGMSARVGEYPVLQTSVRAIECKRKRVKKRMFLTQKVSKAQPIDNPASPTAANAMDALVCTTCQHPSKEGNALVVDESDGCSYCQRCYDEYYAAVSGDVHFDGVVDDARTNANGRRRNRHCRCHCHCRLCAMADTSDELTKCFLSYRMLKDVLESSSIQEDEEAVMVTQMMVDPRRIDEFERVLRLILRKTHTIGHISTCVVKPSHGRTTYTSVVKYANLKAMNQVFPSSVESGVDFYKLLAARDSLLLEPPTYQIEAGFGTWIESDGNTKPMRGDDPEDDSNSAFQEVPGPCCNDSCDNPHGLNVRASFVVPSKNFTLFKAKYQRNNKKGGQKNLRCFPSCRNGRHVSSGFCGDSIRVHVAISRVTESGGVKICPIQTSHHVPAIVTYARFVNMDGAFDASASGPEVFSGQTIAKDDLTMFVRDKDRPMNPLIPGILRGASCETALQSAIFEFNSECKAWHYGWTAPRGQGLSGSDAQHVMEVLFMKPLGQFLFCLERLRSDSFSIYSSRRASHATIKPEPDAFDNEEDDGRGFKRKRRQVPPSPMESTASMSTNSPSASPMADDSNWEPESPHPRQMTMDDRALADASFQLQAAQLRSACPTPVGNNSNNNSNNSSSGFVTATVPQGQTPSFLQSLLSEQGYEQHGLQQQLVEHENEQPQYPNAYTNYPRVVSTEEIPWSELYNLFDASQMPLDQAEHQSSLQQAGGMGFM